MPSVAPTEEIDSAIVESPTKMKASSVLRSALDSPHSVVTRQSCQVTGDAYSCHRLLPEMAGVLCQVAGGAPQARHPRRKGAG